MRQYFKSFAISAMTAIWASGALAVPVIEASYRYEFDVISSDFSWYDGSIVNADTGEDVTDPALAKTIGDLLHPLRAGLGEVGRIVIEMSNMSDEFYDFGGFIDDNEWLELDCLSGFICDAGFLKSRYTHFGGTYSLGADRFHLYASELDWRASFDDMGGGMLRFDGDDASEGTTVVVDTVRYGAQFDSRALFQLANVSVTRLDPQPIPTPIPTSGLMLITALGGAGLVARRRAARRPS